MTQPQASTPANDNDRPVRFQRLVAVFLLTATIVLSACASRDDKKEAESQRGTLRGAADVAVLTAASIDADQIIPGELALSGAAVCDVSVKSMTHATTSPNGTAALISGAVLVPTGAACRGPFTVIAYAHATSRDRTRTMANPNDKETRLLINMYAAKGFVVVATDYLGFGQSDFSYHPYLHADSEATSVIDSVRAARTLLGQSGVPLNGKVLLAGYSQGGHAALAAQRAIERGEAADVAVVATGAMSGPYDLALTFQEGARVLPGIDTSGTATTSGDWSLSLGNALPNTAADFATRGAIGSVLRAQSVTGWASTSPMFLCGGQRDQTVTFTNAAVAAADLRAKGASIVILDVDADASYAALVPAAQSTSEQLSGYHNQIVPPLCFQAVRDRLFIRYR